MAGALHRSRVQRDSKDQSYDEDFQFRILVELKLMNEYLKTLVGEDLREDIEDTHDNY